MKMYKNIKNESFEFEAACLTENKTDITIKKFYIYVVFFCETFFIGSLK